MRPDPISYFVMKSSTHHWPTVCTRSLYRVVNCNVILVQIIHYVLFSIIIEWRKIPVGYLVRYSVKSANILQRSRYLCFKCVYLLQVHVQFDVLRSVAQHWFSVRQYLPQHVLLGSGRNSSIYTVHDYDGHGRVWTQRNRWPFPCHCWSSQLHMYSTGFVQLVSQDVEHVSVESNVNGLQYY